MNSSNSLGEKSIGRLLISFSIPAILGMLVNSLYNIIDRIFIGNHPQIGDMGIAGITISYPIVLLLMCPNILFGVGGSTLFSIRQGEGKPADVQKSLGNSFTLLILAAILCALPCWIFMDELLVLFRAQPDVIPFARQYLPTILAGAVFSAISMGMNNFVRTDGAPATAMITMIIGALTNIILDYIFIYPLNMGLFGAALATIIAQLMSALWVMLYLCGKRCKVRLTFDSIKLKFTIVKKIIIVGMPAFLVQIVCSFINVVLNAMFSTYGGTTAVSGIGIINSIQSIMYMPASGISQGAQPILGYNFGAGKYKRVVKTLKLALIATFVVFFIGFLFTRLFPEQLVRIFNGNDTLVSYTAHAIGIWFLGFPVLGFQIVGANFFQSVGKSGISTVLALSRQVLILLPALMILPRLFSNPLDGVLYAAPLCDVLSSVVTIICLVPEVKRLNRLPDNT